MLKLLITLSLTISLSAMAQVEEKIIGKWRFKDIYNKEVIDTKSISAYEKQSFNNMYIEIKAEGNHESFVMNQQISGQWVLTENKKNLILKTKNSSIMLEILKIDGSEMVVNVGNGAFILENELF